MQLSPNQMPFFMTGWKIPHFSIRNTSTQIVGFPLYMLVFGGVSSFLDIRTPHPAKTVSTWRFRGVGVGSPTENMLILLGWGWTQDVPFFGSEVSKFHLWKVFKMLIILIIHTCFYPVIVWCWYAEHLSQTFVERVLNNDLFFVFVVIPTILGMVSLKTLGKHHPIC